MLDFVGSSTFSPTLYWWDEEMVLHLLGPRVLHYSLVGLPFPFLIMVASSKLAIAVVTVTGVDLNSPATLGVSCTIHRMGAWHAAKLTSFQLIDSATIATRRLSEVIADLDRFAATIVGVDSPTPFTGLTVGSCKAFVTTVAACIQL